MSWRDRPERILEPTLPFPEVNVVPEFEDCELEIDALSPEIAGLSLFRQGFW